MSIVIYSTKDSAAAYRDLRQALKGPSRDWSSSGEAPEPKMCQVCQEDRAGCGWEGKEGDPGRMCARCRSEGWFPGERREAERTS
jgi:hypothetical protein